MKYVVACLAGALLVMSSIDVCSAGQHPNVVLIYADDMGWGDVGYHGVEDVLTPNIDRIAESGVQFTQGYVSASVCGPSRAGLLTGVYQQRFGCGENPNVSGFPDKMKFPLAGLPASQPVISEMLKKRGYHTGHVGKWHMGIDKTLRPLARGFDEYFGFVNGAHDFEGWDGHFGDKRGRWPLWRGDDPLPARNNVYLTDLFSDEAVAFIERGTRNAECGTPFFLYLAYNAIHAPWQVPDTYLERTKHLSDNHERNFIAAMILAMDDGIGRVQEALEKAGVADNTIVIFMSDNGSPRAQGLTWKPRGDVDDWLEGPMSCKAGMRGFKGDTYEGGTRVPFCMSWPGKIKPGTKYELPVSNLDIVPTVLAAASDLNAQQPTSNNQLPRKRNSNLEVGRWALDVGCSIPFDGVDLMPFISGETLERPHETLYWRRDNDYAIRHGDWKLEWNDAGSTRNITLFNLADDPQERNDLAAAMPEKAQALQDLFDAWDSTMPDNEWWGGPINRRRDFAEGGRTVVSDQPYLHAYGKVRAEKKPAPAKGRTGRPNIILLMADDLGVECLGSYGCTEYETPELDRLAADGMRFEHCYSTPLCTPSRVQIMTGRYSHRNYIGFGKLDAGEITFGNVLRDAGYKTMIAGKWQLAGDKDSPKHFGFDEYCLWFLYPPPPGGGIAQGRRYWEPYRFWENGEMKKVAEHAYGPDLFCSYIDNFISRQKENPFFVYYPMALTHAPFEPTPDTPGDVSREWSQSRYKDDSYMKDMVAYMDRIVGRIRSSLEKHGVADNTIILFTGDNGTDKRVMTDTKDGPVQGGKALMTDGGTHVPLVAYHPGTTKPGIVSRDLIDFSDFLPTLAEAAGATLPSDRVIDGVSFLPQLKGEKGTPRDWVFLHYWQNGRQKQGAQEFVRNRRFKLYDDGRFYDVKRDCLETDPIQHLNPQQKRIRRVLEGAFESVHMRGEE